MAGKPPGGAVMRAPLLVLLLVLPGCAALSPAAPVTRVPVPVPCQEPMPERPAMPTESLRPGVDPYTFSLHAMAEIDIRQAFESRLILALKECRAPLAAP